MLIIGHEYEKEKLEKRTLNYDIKNKNHDEDDIKTDYVL